MQQHNQTVMKRVRNAAGCAVQSDGYGGFDYFIGFRFNQLSGFIVGNAVDATVLFPNAARFSVKGNVQRILAISVVNGEANALNCRFCFFKVCFVDKKIHVSHISQRRLRVVIRRCETLNSGVGNAVFVH